MSELSLLQSQLWVDVASAGVIYRESSWHHGFCRGAYFGREVNLWLSRCILPLPGFFSRNHTESDFNRSHVHLIAGDPQVC